MKVCLACQYRFEAVEWACPQCRQAPATQRGTVLFAPSLVRKQDGFKGEYFGDLAKVEGKHFWFRNRNRLLIWALQAYFPGTRKLLEVGCGTGFVLRGIREAFPSVEVAGSELFVEGLEVARARLPGVALYQMDAVRIPFEAEFDVVGAFDVLEHIEQDDAMLGQLHQALRPGGGLMLTVPQHPALWSSADVQACHKRRYTRRGLMQKVGAAGFEVVRVTSFVSSLLALLWASRRSRKGAETIASSSAFQISPRLNGFLEWVLRVESWLIRRGLSLPWGGSLLVIGRKRMSPLAERLTPPPTMLAGLATSGGRIGP